MILKLTSDEHGEYDRLISEYNKKDFDLLVSLGDLGFNYDGIRNLDPHLFRFVGGNHEDYDQAVGLPHYLGNFGLLPGTNGKVFFVRGANTPEAGFDRIPKINWWPQEQLTLAEMEDCLDLWEKCCESVDVLLSHTCPREYTTMLLKEDKVLNFCRTEDLLSRMYQICPPPRHFFGHYHVSWTHTVKVLPSFDLKPRPVQMTCLAKKEVLYVRV